MNFNILITLLTISTLVAAIPSGSRADQPSDISTTKKSTEDLPKGDDILKIDTTSAANSTKQPDESLKLDIDAIKKLIDDLHLNNNTDLQEIGKVLNDFNNHIVLPKLKSLMSLGIVGIVLIISIIFNIVNVCRFGCKAICCCCV